jgi:hypothetical protein
MALQLTIGILPMPTEEIFMQGEVMVASVKVDATKSDNITIDFGWSHSLARGFHSPQKLQSAVSFLPPLAWWQLA